MASAKTFVAMTTGGVREGCADLKGSMLLPSCGGSSLHEPTQSAQHIRTSIEPRNVNFQSVSAVSICSQTDHFCHSFVPARQVEIDVEGEKRKAEGVSDV